MPRFARSFFLTLALLLGGWMLSFSPVLAAPQINNQINYQARLMDASGFPLADGNYSIIFSLYDASTAGTRLWTASGTVGSPTALTVNVQNGLFTVLLGDTSVGGGSQNTLDTVNWNSDQIYLGVTINADSEMTPRKRFASAPQAFNARQLQGMYASSTASGGQTLFTLNQTENNAATGTRSTLDVRSNGTSNANDFLFRGINDLGSTVFSVNRQGNATTSFLNASNIFASMVTSTNLQVNIASFATATIAGQGVCLSNGSFCSSGSVAEADTLQTVTNREAFTTTTLSLFGGLTASNITATGTLNVTGISTLGGITFTNGTGTNATTTNLFSTNLFAINLLSTTGTITSLNFTNSTGSTLNLLTLSANTVTSTAVFVNGQAVCLANGTNCQVASSVDLNWTFNVGGDFVRNATATTDIAIGSSTIGNAPFVFLNNTTTSRFIIGQNSSTGAGADLVIGATTSSGMNSAFQLTGDDLFVAGNIGSASSIYTNGAFIAGTGTTIFGDGLISKTNGRLTLSASENIFSFSRTDLPHLNRWFTTPILDNSIYGGAHATTTVGTGPTGIAFDGAYIWNANSTGNTVSKIDPFFNSVVATLPVGTSPQGVAFDGQYLWVVNNSSSNVSKVDVTTNTVVATTTVGTSPFGIAVAGNFVWVSNIADGTVSKINSLTGVVAATVTVGSGPRMVAYDGEYVWVANAASDNVSKIDPGPATVVATIPVGDGPFGVVYDGSHVWVSNAISEDVSKIDVTTNAVVATTTVGTAPSYVAFDGRQIWVVNTGSDNVSRIDISTNAVVATTAVGDGPNGIVFDGSHMWVANTTAGSVTKLPIGGGSGANMNLHVNLLPDTNNAFDIGSAANSFRDIYASGTARIATDVLVNGVSVCLANGTNCLGSDLNWTFNLAGDFVRNATPTTDIAIGSSTLANAPFAFLNNTTTSRFLIGQNPLSGAGADLVIGATTSSGWIDEFQLSGDDLYVEGNIGTASSIYSNAELVLGNSGPTVYGDGYVRQMEGNLLITADGVIGQESIIIRAGDDPTNAAGDVEITAGDALAGTPGGDVILTPGDSAFGNPGNVYINPSGSTNQPRLRFTSVGGGIISLEAPSTTNIVSYILPFADGASSTVIGTNGSGALTFVSVCLADGTNCATSGSTDLNWTYNLAGDFVRNATGTTDIAIGSSTLGNSAFVFLNNTTTSRLIIGRNSSTGAGADLVIGAATASGMNTLFQLTGDDLFTAGNIGSASSVYTNGAFIAGSGSTYYGNGYINKNDGNLTINASGGFVTPQSDIGVTLGSVSLRYNGYFGNTTSTFSTSTGLFSTSLAFTSATGTSVTTSQMFWNSASGTNLFTGGIVRTSRLNFGASTGSFESVGTSTIGYLSSRTVASTEYSSPGDFFNLISKATTTGSVTNMYVSGKYLYASQPANALVSIIDISDPKFPEIVKTIATGGSNSGGVYVAGNYLYTAAQSSPLQIYDIRSPSTPVLVGTLSNVACEDCVVSGHYLYSVDSDSFDIVDVADPANPRLVSTVATSTGSDIVVQGSYAFVSLGGGNKVNIYDVSNPTSPIVLAQIAGSTAQSLAVSGRFLYLSSNTTLNIYDISSSTNPVLDSTFALGNGSGDMFIADNLLYVSAATTLHVIDVTSSTNPLSRASLTISNGGVHVAGRYLYIGDGTGAYIYDMGGADFANARIGALQTGVLNVMNDVDIGGSLNIHSGLNIGAFGLYSVGSLAVGSTNTTSTFVYAVSSTRGEFSGGLSVAGINVCLSNGTNCGTIGSDTLQSVTARGSFTTTTAQFFGGFVAASSSVTGTLSVIGALNTTGTMNLASQTTSTAFRITVPTYGAAIDQSIGLSIATSSSGRGIAMARGTTGNDVSLFSMTNSVTSSLSVSGTLMLYNHDTNQYSLLLNGAGGVGNTQSKILLNDLDGGDTSIHGAIQIENASTNSSTAVLVLRSPGQEIIQHVGLGSPEGVVYATQGSIYFRTNSATSGTQAYLKAGNNGANGWYGIATTDMLSSSASTDLNWTYNLAGDFVRNATATTDIAIGSSTLANAPFVFLNNTTTSRFLIGQNSSTGAGADLVIGATTASGMNAAFQLSGDDLFVAGNIGSASSVYTNGAFVTGLGSTLYGDGFIAKTNGDLTLSASGDLLVGSTTTFLGNIGFGTSTPVTQLYVPGRVPTSAIGSILGPVQSYSVFVEGRLAYVADSATGFESLEIYDISNPSSPVSVGAVSTTGANAIGMHVQGQYAYTLNQNSDSMDIIDVSNPSSPVVVSTAVTGDGPVSVVVHGKYAYVVNQTANNFQVFDVSNPLSVSLVSTNPTISGPASGVVQGRYFYVVGFSTGLEIFDLSNPSAPASVGTVATGAGSLDVFVQGSYAYVVNNNDDDLQIIDITDPSAPVSVSTVETGSGPYGVHVQGRNAYVANNGGSTLAVIDVSNPSAPVHRGFVATDSGPTSVYVQGRFALVVNSSAGGLQVFDVGGAYIQQLEVGGLEAGALTLTGSLQGEDASFQGGLTVGQSVNISGGLSVVASSTLPTSIFSNRAADAGGQNWGAYIDQLTVGSNASATGSANYSMVLTYASSATFGGLCIDDTSTGQTCPTNVGASIMADGAVISNAFDIAEMYSVTGTSEAGDVLVLDASSTATVMRSTGVAYDSKVIGIVSTDPGFVLGWSGGTKVALAGRVPVKFSTNNGPINVGDALVSSDVPGYAMKATQPGMILGYALESASATGTAQVFVSVGFWAGLAFGPTGQIQVDDSGNVSIMNDLHVGGRFFPSLKGGGIQNDWYLFVNADDPTSTYISTNAAGFMSMDTYDFAERYYSPDELEPGDLVIVSDSGRTHVQRSMNTEQMLLGIVSTRPAFIAGRPATSTYPIALSGRVPTKVSNINGAIKAGDPLSPTSIPGVAAKAIHTGPIIGLALEDFENANIDKIEVFVNPGYWVNKNEVAAPAPAVAPVVSSQIVVSQGKQGFATITAGSKKVRIEFPSLGAYPNVQVTPRGSTRGGWWTDSYTDTGFEIILSETEDHDVVFAWRVEATTASDVMRMSDGTYATVDPITGLPTGFIAPSSTTDTIETSTAEPVSAPAVVVPTSTDPVVEAPIVPEAESASTTVAL
ncbi:hypothetical protein K8R04_04100 [Candidatus Uhrbacteria bacterium]|nr:hypothetical protein [Candidatus Uhrbacteria bacterium]